MKHSPGSPMPVQLAQVQTRQLEKLGRQLCAKLAAHYPALRTRSGSPGTVGSYNLQVYFFCDIDQGLLKIPSFKV